MTTWLTSNVGLASGAGAVAVIAVVAVVTLKAPSPPKEQPVAVLEMVEPTKAPETAVPIAVQAVPATPTVQSPSAPPKPSAVIEADAAASPTVLAAVSLDSAPQITTEPELPLAIAVVPKVEGVPATAPAIIENLQRPTFDLVRVDAEGGAVIAGSASPGATVRIRYGADTVQTITANPSGAFVVLMDLPASGGAHPLVLETVSDGGQIIASDDNVLILPRAPEAKAAPKIILARAAGVTVLQSGAGEVPTADVTSAPVVVAIGAQAPIQLPVASQNFDLSLDTISYDQTGEVVLRGRGTSDQFVRIYVNDKPIETESVRADGQWKVVLGEVKEGVYTLRVDEIDAAGAVTSRVESPFKRETPEIVATAVAPSSVTVQPGHTLWALAQDQYGDGVKYVQIFDANKDRIRNPNLIYPGQVFALPN